jgi:hypothetical protein
MLKSEIGKAEIFNHSASSDFGVTGGQHGIRLAAGNELCGGLATTVLDGRSKSRN